MPLQSSYEWALNLHQEEADSMVARSMSDFSDLQLYVEADVGEPPQRMRLIADTGSAWMWVQTEQCTSCGGANHYNMDQSETLEVLESTRTKHLHYGSGSVSGLHSREKFCLAVDEACDGNSECQPLCVEQISSVMVQDQDGGLSGLLADGVMGLGPVKGADEGFANPELFIDIAYDQG